jgi:tubulin polyglutamylase TTLL6/13
VITVTDRILCHCLLVPQKEYAFYPRTWVLPGELADFRTQFDSQGNSLGNKIFIIKPDTGCQGRGIYLTKTFENVPQLENVVAQLYIKKPLLIEGFKFDLRICKSITTSIRIYFERTMCALFVARMRYSYVSVFLSFHVRLCDVVCCYLNFASC